VGVIQGNGSQKLLFGASKVTFEERDDAQPMGDPRLVWHESNESLERGAGTDEVSFRKVCGY
jgi:hypothetical protein